MYIGSVN